MKKYYFIATLLFLVASCVPAKNVIYLQGKITDAQTITRIKKTPYRLQIDDVLRLEITSNNLDLINAFKKGGDTNSAQFAGVQGQGLGYFSGYSIDMRGNIRVPTLGEINVLGYTVLEVRKKLEEEFKKYIKAGENLFVSVKLFGINYTILGEVNRPGPNVIFQNRVSILEAISNSGDITDLGNRKQIEIFRKDISGVQKHTIDLTTINAFNSDVFYLKPNDYIYIRPLKQKFWGTGITGLQSLTTFVSIFTLITSTIILTRNF